ncbi:hypothetical protein ADK55_10585, partial [Streptomyces sp. WM4235]
MQLSDELKVLYRVVRARSDDFGEDEEYDYEMECQVNTAVGCELFGLGMEEVADEAAYLRYGQRYQATAVSPFESSWAR